MTGARRQNEGTDPWLVVTAVLAIVLVVLVALAVLFLLGAGDGGSTPSASPSTPAASSEPSEPQTSPGVSESPSVAPSVAASEAPTSPPPSTAPSPSPGASPSPSASPGASPSPDASACSGSEENQVFYAQAADTLPFETYCGVLPQGWSLVSGGYRSAGGGKLEISYKGPGGATLLLRQGPAACAEVEGCPPTGTDAGAASFGDRAGTLLDTEAGYAVDASAGATLYLAETTNLDADATLALSAALAPIPVTGP